MGVIRAVRSGDISGFGERGEVWTEVDANVQVVVHSPYRRPPDGRNGDRSEC